MERTHTFTRALWLYRVAPDPRALTTHGPHNRARCILVHVPYNAVHAACQAGPCGRTYVRARPNKGRSAPPLTYFLAAAACCSAARLASAACCLARISSACLGGRHEMDGPQEHERGTVADGPSIRQRPGGGRCIHACALYALLLTVLEHLPVVAIVARLFAPASTLRSLPRALAVNVALVAACVSVPRRTRRVCGGCVAGVRRVCGGCEHDR